MKEIKYGEVKDSLDFVEVSEQHGDWAVHTVTFSYKGKEYYGSLQSDPHLNGTIYDDEFIEDIEEK